MSGRQQGRKLVNRLKRDGQEILVYVDFGAGGIFKIKLPTGDMISDDVYSSAIVKLEEWFSGHGKLKFEPVIIAEYTASHGLDDDHENEISSNEGQLSLRYRRYFRAFHKNVAGGRVFLWKDWVEIGKTPDMPYSQQEDLLEGKPGKETRSPISSYWKVDAPDEPDKNQVIIPYTAARWAALRVISHSMRLTNEKLKAIFHVHHAWGFEEFLDKVKVNGFQALTHEEEK